MISSDRIILPRTTLSVSRLCLGGNRFGGGLGEGDSFALLDAFVEAGGNFIDTAHVYADWIEGNEKSSSEKAIGRWLKSRRPEGIVVATKGGHPALSPPRASRLDAASLRRDVEESLTFLGVPSIDLFYLHRDDPARPAGDILGALEGLRKEGLLRHYGASNWSAERLAEAQRVASAENWQGFIANQPEWSLAARNTAAAADDLCAMDNAMILFHRLTGVAAIPYSAQAKGYFDKIALGVDPATARIYDNERNHALAVELARIAARHDVTPTQTMLAAMIRAPFTTVPVVGCRTPDQVRSSFQSLTVNLSRDEATRLLELAGV